MRIFGSFAAGLAAFAIVAPSLASGDQGSPVITAQAAVPQPAQSASPQPNADAISALESRLDELQRRSSAEIEALREEIAHLRGGHAPTANATAPPAVGVAPPSSPQDVGAPQIAQPQAAVTAAPRSQSVQSVYQQQNALFTPHFTLTPSITETYTDQRFFTLNGFLALGAIFLGNVNVTRQQTNYTIAQLDAAYGVTDRLQLEATIPGFLSSGTFTSVGANEAGEVPAEDRISTDALGDIQLGDFYQISRETARTPSIVLSDHISIPTGRAPYGIKLLTDASNSSLMYPGSFPTGSGVFGIQVGASFVKTTDPAIWFGGVNYYINGRHHFNDLSSTPGDVTPGNAQPGNSFEFSLGTAFALNDAASLSFSFTDTISNAIVLQPDGSPPSSVVGSNTNAAVLGVGTGFAISPTTSVMTQLGVGLTQDAPNFQLSVRVPHRF